MQRVSSTSRYAPPPGRFLVPKTHNSPKGKVVLVTGGAKGIGRMISEGFVANGAKVYISSRDAQACAQAAAELTALGKAAGGSALALPADLQSLDACEALAAELTIQLGGKNGTGLDVLVNNSGAAWGAPFDTHPDHAWTKLLTLNLQRVFTLTQLLTPLLTLAASSSSSPSRVINIGSIDALRVPHLENYAYSASKAGLHQLSRTMAVALGPRGVTVNTLACGPFPSKMMKAVLDTVGDELAEVNPLGRIGTPQDVAGACLFLTGRAG